MPASRSRPAAPGRSGLRRLLRNPVGLGIAAVAAVGVSSTLIWASWPSSEAAAAPPLARVYSAYSACLLTDAAGIASPSAQSVWSGMESASSATSMKVSYLAAVGPGDAADVQSYLNTLLQRRCDVVVAVGARETAAVAAVAGADSGVHFVVVGAPSSGANVASVSGAATAVAAGVEQDLVAANAGRFDRWAQGAAG